MRKLAWAALLLGFATGASFAQGSAAARELIELSMLVTGDVLIEPDGKVSGWEIDQPEELPGAVTRLIEESAPTWRFEPVLIAGQTRRAKARMSLRLTANALEDGNYRIALQSAHFGAEAMEAEERLAIEGTDALQILKRKAPVYPMPALERGVRGSVYVVSRIGPDGKVLDAIAEQVNLRTLGTASQMESMRNMLARSAVRAIHEWTFQPPTTGELASRGEWSVRIAVDYVIGEERAPGYGKWYAYIPGPRQRAPWLQADDLGESESPDTLVAGGFRPVGQGIRLLTPLQRG